jgi:signal peptidase I
MATNTSPEQAPSWLQRMLIGRKPKRTLVRVVVLVVVAVFVFSYVLLPIRVDGGSMLPTYKENGVNLVYRLAYRSSEPRRGDVVAVRLLAGGHRMYMKRIVGLPGETVAFHAGQLYINDKVLNEPYVKFPCNWEIVPKLVGPGEYYVVGDNRDNAWEWHVQGRAARELIVGKVLL